VYWRHSLFIGVNVAFFSKTYYNTKFEDLSLRGAGVVSVSEIGTTAFLVFVSTDVYWCCVFTKLHES